MGSREDDVAALKQRADKLRESASQARALARTLGPFLDDATRKAAARAVDPGHPGDAIWLGPYADACTSTLRQRQGTLHGMASSLMADATRWESAASDLDSQAKAKAKPTAPAGSH